MIGKDHSASTTRHVLVAVVTLSVICMGIGGPIAAQETTDAGADQSNSSESLEPAIEIESNSTDLSHVVLKSVTLPENGYIAAYGENFTAKNPTNSSVIGRTQYVRAGQFSDVVVEFNGTIAKNTTVSVMVHNETNGNEKFNFASKEGPDSPYLNGSGYPIVDQVRIEDNDTAVEPGAFSPNKLSESQDSSKGSSKLVITSNSSNASYSFSATENVSSETAASNTTIKGTNVSGSVGSSNSTFTYSGAISSFEADENINVVLNGRTVDPEVLGANRITLTKNGSQVGPGTVEYGFTASGPIVPGGTNEDNETVSDQHINGSIGDNDQTDTIYYAGRMTKSRLLGDAKVIINGRVTSESTGSGTSAGQQTATPDLGQLPSQSGESEETPTGQDDGSSESASGSPDFRVSNITLNSQKIEASKKLRVNATITNTGSSKVTANIGLASEGSVVDDTSAGLFAGGSRRITFEHTYKSPGEYILKIALLSEDGKVLAMSTVDKTVTVVAEGKLDTATATTTTSSGGPGFGLFAGMVGVLVAALSIRYWKGSA